MHSVDASTCAFAVGVTPDLIYFIDVVAFATPKEMTWRTITA
jgi:hypothetical protein